MNEKQLKDIFKQGYNFQYWKQVLDFVFGKVEYFSTPNNPFAEDKKVISGKQYGRIKLEDAKSIALFEVQVDDSVDIERNRQGLREIAAKYIDQNITHGAIVFFYSPTQEIYRFTFIAKWSDIDLETGELQKGETQKKRYTYLLGSNQSGTTAAKRLLELANRKPVIAVKDIIQAFSVEALTKEFFKKYKEHYERFWRFIDDKPGYQKLLLDNSDEKNEDDKRKPIRDFSKKLLGRIVFLHFLQKKGWLGCPVLPTKKENEEIWIDGNPNFMMELFRNFNDKEHFYGKCLTALFFNTLNEPDRTNNVFAITNKRVPYLNGGLFDNDQPHTDGINFPSNYFQELLEFFEQYNFTIDENSPDEQEVGIDPEMLGHIFENLLEENREKGAFYTPKEIVHYMCQESLVQYLKNHLPEEAQVEEFIRQQNVSAYLRDKANAIQLNQLLDEVKVCDPAIGSGAFPIGILQEIYKAKIHIYPYLQTLSAFDPAETKKKIIEESIYGVDLEHGAVEIARLRFWLALVVDEDKPQPLPNLDYKIMQGNSLLERFEGIDLSMVTKTKKNIKVVEPERDLFGNITDNQMKMTFTQTETVKEIQGLMKKYFNVKKPADKAILKTKINEAVHKHIDVNLELREGQLARLLSEAENERALNAKGQKKLEELRKEVSSFAQKRAKLHKIQNTEEKPYFIWHLFFKDVFDKGGFDIVIGNPPYIQIQKLGNDIEYLAEANFKTFAKSGDIYCLFYEKGNSLLKDNGNLCFITSNKWMNAAYGKGFRKFLIEETNPILLIDFSKAVIFPAAVVFVNILQFRKEKSKKNLIGIKADSDYQVGKVDLFEYVQNHSVIVTELSEDGWTVAEKQDFQITQQIELIGTPLKNWDVKFFRGVTTGLNEVFHIDNKTKDILVSQNANSEEVIKPLLRGKDIKRYKYFFDDVYIIFTKHGIDIEKYPAIKSYLKKYKDQLTPKVTSSDIIGRKPGSYQWYEIQDNTAYYPEFENDKIVWIEISDRANYCLDTNRHYLTNSAYFLTGSNLKYLLALLNSKLIDFYFYQKTAQIAGGRKRYTKQYVELLPIIKVDDTELVSKFELIVDYIIFLNDEKSPQVNIYTENGSLIPLFEDLINMMVYELYFEAHMKELQIDVLKFIKIGKEFRFLEEGNYSKNKNTISLAYQWLQERENPIRTRIILSNIHSKEIISKINSTTL